MALYGGRPHASAAEEPCPEVEEEGDSCNSINDLHKKPPLLLHKELLQQLRHSIY